MEVKTIDNSIENLIITGMIVDSKFFRDVFRATKPEYFNAEVSKILVRWLREYYEGNNSSAPGSEMTSIFELNKNELDKDEETTTRIFLKRINQEYSGKEFNRDYILPKALKYLERNSLEYKTKLIVRELKRDNVEAAKTIFENATGDVFNEVSEWKSFSNMEIIHDWWDMKKESVLRFSNGLGEYMPPIERGRLYAMLGPAKRGKCISGKSLITLSDGRVLPLHEVVTNKMTNVVSLDSNHKFVSDEVIDWLYVGEKMGYMIHTKSGRSIESSQDHRFLTPSGWKRLYELSTGDLIAVRKLLVLDQKEHTISESEVKILAYLIADGHLQTNQGMTFTKYDLEIMSDCEKCVQDIGDNYSIKREILRIFKNGRVAQLLQQEGLHNKLAGDKFIPNCIMQSSLDNIRVFLKTLFTCDGSIFKYRNTVTIEYCSKSKLLIQQVSMCLQRFGIFGKLSTKFVNGIPYYVISFQSSNNVLLYMKEIGFIGLKQRKGEEFCKSLQTKRDYIDIVPKEYIQIIGDEIKRKGEGFKNHGFKVRYDNYQEGSRTMLRETVPDNHIYLNTDIIWDRITTIAKTDYISMYDLEVKNNHNYIADEFVVHNSHWLLEWAYNGVMDGLNVVIFSLEMSEAEIDIRWKTKISGKAMMNEESKVFRIPVMDCLHNQKNDCGRKECVSKGTHVLKNNIKSPFEDNKDHIPCTECRGKDDIFAPAHWFIEEKIKRLTLQEAIIKQKSFDNHFGVNRVQIKSFPISTATVMDLERALDELEMYKGFIPDLVIVDYADILKEDIKIGEKRHRVGDNWKQLSKMAKVRNIVVVTASQGNRGSAKKNRLDVDDVSEDFSKIMTIDGIFAINEENHDKQDKFQSDKYSQVQRIETIALRYGKFMPGLQCITMNDLERGQICIDSYIKWK